MEHLLFLALNYIVFLVLIYIDKKDWKTYAFISLVGLFLAFIFENVTTYWGFWYYHSEPKVPFVSLYTLLLYVPYLSFSHFIVRRLDR